MTGCQWSFRPPASTGYGAAYNRPMYIIAIAWLYVTVLMAATQPTLLDGLATFVFLGLAPLALMLWILGSPARRRRSAGEEASRQTPEDR